MSLADFLPFSPIFRRETIAAAVRPTATIALGGGGARGLAHLGAIQAIGEAGIQTERFVGTSMGALVGALCALDRNVARAQADAIEFLLSPNFIRHQAILFGSQGVEQSDAGSGIMAWYNRVKHLYSAHRRLTRAITRNSLLPETMLTESIAELIPDVEFSDLSVPLSVVAADLRSGHRIILESGSVRHALAASMSLPGIFAPVPHGEMLLCDIGVVDSLPTSAASSYRADLTIAIDVGQRLPRAETYESAVDVMMRMQDIGEQILRREKVELADIHIRPELAETSWFDFRKPQWLIHQGHRAARETIHAFLRRNGHRGASVSQAG